MARIGHIILNVSDFTTSEKFYDRILLAIGFVVDYSEITSAWAAKSYRCNEHNIWIKWDGTTACAPFVRCVGLDHIAFDVASKDEVDTLYAELQAAGVYITRPPSHFPEYSPEYYAFYFRDPDQIPLEIASK